MWAVVSKESEAGRGRLTGHADWDGEAAGRRWRRLSRERRCLRLRAHSCSDLVSVALQPVILVASRHVTVTVTRGSLLIDAGSGSDSYAFPASTFYSRPDNAQDDQHGQRVVCLVFLPP